MIAVVDASVVVKLFVHEPDAAAAEAVVSRTDVVAPELILLEVGNALRRKASDGDVPVETVLSALHLIRRRFTLTPDADLAIRAAELALAIDHPVSDCVYLALAEQVNGTLVTADRRLVELGGTLGIEVQPLS